MYIMYICILVGATSGISSSLHDQENYFGRMKWHHIIHTFCMIIFCLICSIDTPGRFKLSVQLSRLCLHHQWLSLGVIWREIQLYTDSDWLFLPCEKPFFCRMTLLPMITSLHIQVCSSKMVWPALLGVIGLTTLIHLSEPLRTLARDDDRWLVQICVDLLRNIYVNVLQKRLRCFLCLGFFE